MGVIDPTSSATCWTINGRFVSQRITGVQRYAREIVGCIDEILSGNKDLAKYVKFELVLPPGAAKIFDLLSIRNRQTSFGTGHMWEQIILPRYAAAGLLSLGNSGPLTRHPQVVCIHDANLFIRPESYSLRFRLAYRALLPLIGRNVRRVATVSRFSAQMLTKYNICCPEKIFIAPNGHEHALRWNAGSSELALLEKLKRPYLLLLGSRAKHKNNQVIIAQAEALDQAGMDIVVVGGASSIFASEAVKIARSNVHYTGYVSDNDLAALYDRAACLVFPSLVEGFGLPLLEAMVRGCPVISSNAASLVEVGGNAALYVDPERSDAWRDAIVGLSKNQDLRATLVGSGRERIKLFSWKRTAEIYIDEILKCINH